MRLPKGYYVYGHKDINTGLWIYIGKGINGRGFDSAGRGEEHAKYLENNEVEVEILKDRLTEKEAFELEEEVIAKLIEEGYSLYKGKYTANKKALFNRNLGGAGGKGNASAGARKVICVTTGEEFNSISEATEKTGARKHSIGDVCKGYQKSCYVNNKLVVFKFKNPTTEEEARWNSIHKNPIVSTNKKKRVKCVETGEVFGSVASAMSAKGVYLDRCLDHKDKTSKGYHWVTITEEEYAKALGLLININN